MTSRRSALVLLAAAALAGAVQGPARAQGPLESQVKAAFITKFPAFVGWPPGALGAGEPLKVCVQGDDSVGDALVGSDGQAVGDRSLRVRRYAEVARDTPCDILYAAGSARQPAAAALAAVRGAPVLTITDALRGPARGMIHFVVFQNRVRFHIDAAQAAHGGLAMNSKLLALGLSVKR